MEYFANSEESSDSDRSPASICCQCLAEKPKEIPLCAIEKPSPQVQSGY